MTEPERILWKKLRELPPEFDVTFRRQHPVHPYILDFACIKIRLAVELDGMSHDNASEQRRDKIRDDFLVRKGYTVLRFTNDELLADGNAVIEAIIHKALQLKQAQDKALPPWGEGWVGGQQKK